MEHGDGKQQARSSFYIFHLHYSFQFPLDPKGRLSSPSEQEFLIFNLQLKKF